MDATTQTLYETDFVEWTVETADLLRARRLDQIDLERVAEEIEDLGKSERSGVAFQLHRMMMHLIKQSIQPERDGTSWRRSLAEGRAEIACRLDDSPSLRRFAQNRLQNIYARAVNHALFETGLADRRK